MPEMLAVIPFYQRRDLLDRCLACLAASTLPIEAFVHDNNVQNVGFTRACNLGLHQAMRRGHRYAMLLNQDCYVRPDSVANAVAFMDAHPRCAVCGPKQLLASDPDVIIHGGCTQAFPTGQHLVGRVSRGDCTVSRQMPWVNGACMVIRVDALYHTGLMDEGCVLIASDSDFCFTARQRGYEVWYCAESAVLHEAGGISSRQQSLAEMAQFNADQRYFRNKWIGTLGWELLKEAPRDRKLTGEETSAAIRRAGELLSKGQLPQAELILQNLLTCEPDHPDGLLLFASVLLRQGLPALAAREAQKLTPALPNHPNPWALLADSTLACGLAAEAVGHYQRALQLGLDVPELHVNLGHALNRAGRRDEAVARWQHALARLAPDAPLAASTRKLLESAVATAV